MPKVYSLTTLDKREKAVLEKFIEVALTTTNGLADERIGRPSGTQFKHPSAILNTSGDVLLTDLNQEERTKWVYNRVKKWKRVESTGLLEELLEGFACSFKLNEQERNQVVVKIPYAFPQAIGPLFTEHGVKIFVKGYRPPSPPVAPSAGYGRNGVAAFAMAPHHEQIVAPSASGYSPSYHSSTVGPFTPYTPLGSPPASRGKLYDEPSPVQTITSPVQFPKTVEFCGIGQFGSNLSAISDNFGAPRKENLSPHPGGLPDVGRFLAEYGISYEQLVSLGPECLLQMAGQVVQMSAGHSESNSKTADNVQTAFAAVDSALASQQAAYAKQNMELGLFGMMTSAAAAAKAQGVQAPSPPPGEGLKPAALKSPSPPPDEGLKPAASKSPPASKPPSASASTSSSPEKAVGKWGCESPGYE